MWQDYAFTVCGIIFTSGLIPQIRINYLEKNASFISWSFCILYMLAIMLSGITCYSLGLMLSTILSGCQLTAWMIIAFQKVHYSKGDHKCLD